MTHETHPIGTGERLKRLEALAETRKALLVLIVGNANEAMPMGPFDCIDNAGEPYQSEAFCRALSAARKHLALSTLRKNEDNEHE